MTDVEMEQVTYSDVADKWQTFFLITLPQAWRGIAGVAMMMCARGISEFDAVAIIAHHPKVLSVLVYGRFIGFGLNLSQPVTVILILISVVVFITFSVLVQKEK